MPAIIYLFKVKNKSTRKRCELCSMFTIKTPERRRLVSLWLTLNIFHTFFSVSIANFEHIIVCSVPLYSVYQGNWSTSVKCVLNCSGIIEFFFIISATANIVANSTKSSYGKIYGFLIVMLCTIWSHFYILKNVKNTHGGVLLSVKLQAPATLLKVTLLHWHFSRFLNCTNDTKSRNASHILYYSRIQNSLEHLNIPTHLIIKNS